MRYREAGRVCVCDVEGTGDIRCSARPGQADVDVTRTGRRKGQLHRKSSEPADVVAVSMQVQGTRGAPPAVPSPVRFKCGICTARFCKLTLCCVTCAPSIACESGTRPTVPF